jgi:hypothetical protein
MNLNKLPEYFAIKWSNNPLWKDYIKWLNETYNTNLNGSYSACFYGYDGFKVVYESRLLFFKNPVTELTLEQWDNIINKKNEFKLPEKWYIKRDEKNYSIINRWFNNHVILDNAEWSGREGNMNYPRIYNQLPNLGELKLLQEGYTEITFEQFKQYVLKENNMNKEIIGYKLIKPEYENAALTLCNLKNWGISTRDKTLDLFEQHLINRVKEAGVLDLWFEPIYKEEKTLPKINGYEGKLEKTMQLEGDLIVYGCAKFSTYWIEELYKAFEKIELFSKNNTRKLKSIKLDSGVEITIEQIKQIYEYIKSKD